jgi:hypothetical protein
MILGFFRKNNDPIWSSYEGEMQDTRFMQRLKINVLVFQDVKTHLNLGPTGGTHRDFVKSAEDLACGPFIVGPFVI